MQEFLLPNVGVWRRALALHVGVVERDCQQREGMCRLHVQVKCLSPRMIKHWLDGGSQRAGVERTPGRFHARSLEQFINFLAVRGSKRSGKSKQIDEWTPVTPGLHDVAAREPRSGSTNELACQAVVDRKPKSVRKLS